MRAIIIISGKVSHNALDVEAGILPSKTVNTRSYRNFSDTYKQILRLEKNI